jgi:hypothetical protein
VKKGKRERCCGSGREKEAEQIRNRRGSEEVGRRQRRRER